MTFKKINTLNSGEWKSYSIKKLTNCLKRYRIKESVNHDLNLYTKTSFIHKNSTWMQDDHFIVWFVHQKDNKEFIEHISSIAFLEIFNFDTQLVFAIWLQLIKLSTFKFILILSLFMLTLSLVLKSILKFWVPN